MNEPISRTLLRRLPIALLLGLIAFSLFGPNATAADFRTGTDITIGPAEQITDSLYTAGQNTTIAGRVTGDVIATGKYLNITGRVDGAVNALVVNADISGIVGGSLRVGGGDVTISGQIIGDVLVASGSLEITKTGSVSGDVLLESGSLDVSGPVSGEIKGNASDVTINAPVSGGVDVAVKTISLGSLARIAGEFDYTSPDSVTTAPGATVSGVTKHTTSDRIYPGSDIKAWLFSPLFRLLSLLVTGVVFVVVFPAMAAAGADGIRRSPLVALLLGVLAAIFTPIGIVLLGVTIVGLPAALLGIIATLTVLYLSQVFAGLAIGRWILPKTWDAAGRGYNLLAMAIGVVLIGVARLIPAPHLSSAISVLVALLALGGVVSAARHARRRAAA
jgi:cytoskeletal protein CcmA (bactofilin family)